MEVRGQFVKLGTATVNFNPRQRATYTGMRATEALSALPFFVHFFFCLVADLDLGGPSLSKQEKGGREGWSKKVGEEGDGKG